MNCKQRNKKLFKNIALGILILVIVYIFVEVFFSGKKIQEGMSSNDDIIDYKLDVETWTFTPEEIAPYIQADHDRVMEKATQAKESKGNDSSSADTEKHFNDLKQKIENKIGSANMSLLNNAVNNDPDGEIGELIESFNEIIAQAKFAEAKDLKKKLNTLIEDMEKRRAKTTTSD